MRLLYNMQLRKETPWLAASSWVRACNLNLRDVFSYVGLSMRLRACRLRLCLSTLACFVRALTDFLSPCALRLHAA